MSENQLVVTCKLKTASLNYEDEKFIQAKLEASDLTFY